MCVALSLAVLAGATVAADADTLVKEGVALRRAGDDLAAVRKFEQAHAIEQSPRTAAQLGLAEQALGRWGAADRHLRAALAAPSDAWMSKNRKSIEQALKTVEQRVGQLEIVGSPPGSEVRVDGELVGKLPLERAVAATAGSVAVEVRAPGYLTMVRSSQIATGGVTRESFNLQPIAPAATEPVAGNPTRPAPVAVRVPVTEDPAPAVRDRATDQPPPSGEGDAGGPGMPAGHIAAIVSGGLAVGALAFALYEHVKWQDRVSTFERNNTCYTNVSGHGSPWCNTVYEDGQTARTLAFVGYGAAGALAAAAIVFYVITPAPSSTSVACAIDPGIVGPSNLGVSCGGRF